MTTRRGFFGECMATVAAAAGARAVATFNGSDGGVPPRVDVREGDNPSVPIEIRRHGVALAGVVAYDLAHDSVTVYRRDPNGQYLIGTSKFEFETLRGGVSVHWKATT